MGRFATAGVLPWLIFVGVLSISAPSFGDEQPSGPVRILVPLGVGSQTDVLARMLAQHLSETWRQPVTVDNRPGAFGSIAGSALIKAARDGRTLMVHSDGHVVSAAMYADKLPYDTLRDISRVSLLASFPTILVAGPGLGANSVQELVDAARARPGEITFGSAGSGGGLHLAGEMFKVAAKINVIHVPYKGPAPALTEVLSGRLHFMFAPPGLTMPHIGQGKLRALAVGSPRRFVALPDVPTIAESGLPGFAYELWSGLFVATGTSSSMITGINREVDQIMASPNVRAMFSKQFLEYRKNTPEDFDQFVRVSVTKLKEVIVSAGITVD